MKYHIKASFILFSLLLFCSFPLQSDAQFKNRTFCIYSPVGKAGPVTNIMNRYKAAATRWNIRFDLQLYSNELEAKKDFIDGSCDAVLLSDMRTRDLVRFGGGLSQAGGIPTFKHLKKVISTLSRPGATQYLRTDQYEVVGFFPIGKAYLFLRPNVMNQTGSSLKIEDFAGKKFAILHYDEQSKEAAKSVDAEIVNADITNIFSKFNNGAADIIYSTASAYKPMQLYKGLGKDGRIIKKPVLGMMTFQITIHRDRFPDDFGNKSRQFSRNKFSFTKRMALSYQSKVPSDYWLEPNEQFVKRLQNILGDLRRKFTERGIYEKRMTEMFKKIRCNVEPERKECK